jgi:hypothetical protein
MHFERLETQYDHIRGPVVHYSLVGNGFLAKPIEARPIAQCTCQAGWRLGAQDQMPTASVGPAAGTTGQ